MNNRIRILHIINTLDIGGAEVLLAEAIPKMDKNLFENFVSYLIGVGSLKDTLISSGVKIYDLSWHGKFDPFIICKLMVLINKIKPDIIHTHGIQSDLVGHLVCLLKNFKNRVTTQHSASHPKNNSLIYRLARMLTHRAKKVIAVSKYCEQYLINTLNYEPGIISVVYNGIDFSKFLPKEDYHRMDKYLRIGTLGRLHAQKGIETLIKAVKLIGREIEMICFIPGSGLLEKFLKAMVKDLNLTDKVRFLGPLYSQEKLEYLRSLDIFVQPSYQESFGISILEAMAMGLPIIASRVDGIPELITHGETGILVKPKDERELANALIKLGTDCQLRKVLGVNAKNFAYQFSLDKTILNLEKVYCSIVRNRYFNTACKSCSD